MLNRLVQTATHPYTFVIKSITCRCHKYGLIWNNPIVSEELACECDLGSSQNPYAVAAKKAIGGEMKVFGHVPRNISYF